MKVKVKRAFISYSFLSPKNNKKANRLYMKLSKSTQSFCCPFLFDKYLNLQARINEMVNKHTVDRAYFRKAGNACSMNAE